MAYRSRRRRTAFLAATTSVALLSLVPAVTSASALDVVDTGGTTSTTSTTFAPQLVTVDTPTRADKELLQTLGLDLTEHAGHDYVEVLLHTAVDLDALKAAGLTYDVRIADMTKRQAEINAANDAYAAATAVSPLPSGRDTYRTLADYNADMTSLAQQYPTLVKKFALPHTSLDGRTVYGVEIGRDVKAPESGLPVFAMFGLHHAREWPSGEHAMEFAFDLARSYGKDSRITDLVNRSRTIIVPVVNVDGFQLSRTDGELVDLRDLNQVDPLDGTTSVLATPGNAYKRKNCRIVDGQDTPDGTCATANATSPGGYGSGVDLNRNYGGFWGGPGASSTFADPTYRGASSFSEPETQNIRELISGRQVTMMISNHTFSNLVLRPNGVAPTTIGFDGLPVGDPPDEDGMKALGARMAAQNGYQNIHGWQLYDTTGTTEDWSYNATGGYGYTFEIGPNEFHPPFPEVVDEYLGAGKYAGKGNRAAYLIALENTVDTATHAVLTGKAPKGATLRLRKTFATPTWESSFQDTLSSTMQVGSSGKYTWHVNQSTRPVVMDKQVKTLATDPVKEQTWTGTTAPLASTDQEFVVDQDVDLLDVTLDWPTPDDMDLEVYKKNADGSLTEVGSSGNFVNEKEHALIQSPEQGTYVLRVINYASVTPEWTLDAKLFNSTTDTVYGLVENWTLTCEKNGKVLQRDSVLVDRGEKVQLDLKTCISKWNSLL